MCFHRKHTSVFHCFSVEHNCHCRTVYFTRDLKKHHKNLQKKAKSKTQKPPRKHAQKKNVFARVCPTRGTWRRSSALKSVRWVTSHKIVAPSSSRRINLVTARAIYCFLRALVAWPTCVSVGFGEWFWDNSIVRHGLVLEMFLQFFFLLPKCFH